jgi:hypothetical protein
MLSLSAGTSIRFWQFQQRRVFVALIVPPFAFAFRKAGKPIWSREPL